MKYFFERDLDSGFKYFLTLKVKLNEATEWKPLHNSIIVTKENLSEYLNFLNWQITLKAKAYSDFQNYKTLAFEITRIPKAKINTVEESKSNTNPKNTPFITQFALALNNILFNSGGVLYMHPILNNFTYFLDTYMNKYINLMFLSIINNYVRGILSDLVLHCYVCCLVILAGLGIGLVCYYHLVAGALVWSTVILTFLSLGWGIGMVYKFYYFKINSTLVMETVDVEEEVLFNQFLKAYVEAGAWLLTPCAMLFLKIYISLNIYDFVIASAVLGTGLYLLSLHKVIYLCFKVYSGFSLILAICEDVCYNWARMSQNSDGKVFNTLKFSINNRNYSLGQVRRYTSSASHKADVGLDSHNAILVSDDKDIGEKERKLDKIRLFLQGDEPNLVGTVLGFTKRVSKYIENNQKKVLHDSFLIYFDHISGSISRHLINRGLIESNYKLIINDKVKIPTIYNKNFVLSEEQISPLLKTFLERDDYNNNNISYEDLNNVIPSIRNFSNKENSEIFAIYTNKPFFDLLLDLTNRSSSTYSQEIWSIRNNYCNTIYSGKLDSGFYSTFIDNLILTYLTGYPNLYDNCLYTTSILSWLECLNELRLRSFAETENRIIKEKFFNYFDYKLKKTKTNRVIFPTSLYNYKDIKNPIIRIPNVFYSNKNINQFNKTLSLYNPNIKFKIESYTLSNSPDAIKILKSMINGNLFFTEKELEIRG